MTGLRWETELHPTETRGVVGVRERSSQGKRFPSEDATYNDRGNKPLSCGRPVAQSEEHGARSKGGLWGEAKRAGDSQQGREWDVAYRRPDMGEPLGSSPSRPPSRGFNPPRRLPSCAYKAPGDPSFAGASFSFLPACVTPPLLFRNLLLSLVWRGNLIPWFLSAFNRSHTAVLPTNLSSNWACSSRTLHTPQTPRYSAVPLASICLRWTHRRR